MPQNLELLPLLPEIVLSVCGTLVMVLDAALGNSRKALLGVLALAGIYCAGVGALLSNQRPGEAFSGMVTVDNAATFFRLLVAVVGFLTVLGSMSYLRRESLPQGEFYALILFSLAGQGLMAVASELILLFLGLEISSLATYVLTGFLRRDARSSEAALKYFFLGSFATAFLLYGVALTYGATGATRLTAIRQALDKPDTNLSLVALAAALLLVGIGFKVSAAPFQVWTPDVYQGAPSPVAGFLSTAPKAAAFAMLLRVFFIGMPQAAPAWTPMLWILALLSMTVGNFGALLQTNIKRLLAYSSIAHAGYVLVAFTARTDHGVTAALVYLAVYGFMNLGAFLVVSHLAGPGERYLDLEDYAGLGERQPFLAALLALFLLSLIGVPLTAGFFGKFYIFRAAVNAGLIWLAVLGLLNSALAAYYYLKVLVVMYMRAPAPDAPAPEPLPAALAATLVISAGATLVLGVRPGRLVDFVQGAAGW